MALPQQILLLRFPEWIRNVSVSWDFPEEDPRFLATEIICYSDLWEYFGIRDLNYCGMQVAPCLYKLVDVPDLQGLIAPRPLLVDIGAYDTCFTLDSTMRCYNKVKNIYAAAEVPECLELDLFCGDHGWGDYKS